MRLAQSGRHSRCRDLPGDVRRGVGANPFERKRQKCRRRTPPWRRCKPPSSRHSTSPPRRRMSRHRSPRWPPSTIGAGICRRAAVVLRSMSMPSSFDVASCTFGDKTATTTVALVGDSRAQMWLDTFNNLGLSQHFKLVFMAKNGCPVPLGSYQTNNNGTVSKSTWSACTSFHSFVASTLKSLNPAAIVVSSNYELELANPPHLASPKEVKADTVKFLESLPTTSKTVVLGGFPQPADTANPTLCLSKGPKQINSCNFVPSHTVDAENAAAQSAAKHGGCRVHQPDALVLCQHVPGDCCLHHPVHDRRVSRRQDLSELPHRRPLELSQALRPVSDETRRVSRSALAGYSAHGRHVLQSESAPSAGRRVPHPKMTRARCSVTGSIGPTSRVCGPSPSAPSFCFTPICSASRADSSVSMSSTSFLGLSSPGVLLRKAEASGSLGFKDFYARRARRILPAAGLVLLVTIFASYHWLGFIRGAEVADDAALVCRVLGQLPFSLDRHELLCQSTSAVAAAELLVVGRRGAVLPRLSLPVGAQPGA